MDSKLLKRLAFLSFVLVPFPGCSDDGEEATTLGDDDTSDGGDDDDDDDDDSDPTDASQTMSDSDTDPTTVTDTDPTTVTDTDPTTVTDTDPTDPDSSSTDPTDATESSTTDPTDATESSSTDPSATESSSTTDTDTAVGDCVEVAITSELIVVAPNVFRIEQPDLLGDADVDDIVQFEFYTADTGTFDLAADPNTNYSMCEQCVVIAEDLGAVLYFQAEGSLDVADDPTDGDFAGSLTGVRLVQVEIDPNTFVSTPVKDGGCIEITDGDVASADAPDVPAEWTCNPAYYATDDGCDCGCGALDPDCVSEDIDSCEFCNNEGSCNTEACPGTIDPNDISTCA